MNIIIKGDKYGSLFACTEIGTELFQFEYRATPSMGGPAWYFWLRGNYDPNIFNVKRNQFPIQFFMDAIRAKHFIYYGGSVDDEVNIVSGWSYIK